MVGPLQIIYGGKAHPNDAPGKALIRDLFEVRKQLQGAIQLVYVENYDMEWAKWLTSGVDLWLNTPQRPLEASGTSGMKAVLNGVPSLSVLDGWWVEGHVEGKTGWAIGHGGGIGGAGANRVEALRVRDNLRGVERLPNLPHEGLRIDRHAPRPGAGQERRGPHAPLLHRRQAAAEVDQRGEARAVFVASRGERGFVRDGGFHRAERRPVVGHLRGLRGERHFADRRPGGFNLANRRLQRVLRRRVDEVQRPQIGRAHV